MTMKTALVMGKPVRYTVRRSRRARRLNMRVSQRTGLEIVLPPRWTMADVSDVLVKQAAWIDRQVDRFDVRGGPRVRELTSGDEILVFGRPRRLEVRSIASGAKRARVDLRDDDLIVFLTPADRLDPRPSLERWLRRLAGRHIRARVHDLAARHGFRPDRIFVGERRTRWGSCSSRGNLSFCYRLVMAPEDVVDAVVCHELCHLRHMNHGPAFRKLLDRVFPDEPERMAWLAEHHEEMSL